MKTLFVILLPIILSFLGYSIAPAPRQPRNCDNVKTGTFYFKSVHTGDEFKVLRDEEVQTEIMISTGDSTFWKIDWQNSCKFYLTFIGKSESLPEEQVKTFGDHRVIVEILEVKKKYYIFKAGLDSFSKGSFVDMFWILPSNKQLASSFR